MTAIINARVLTMAGPVYENGFVSGMRMKLSEIDGYFSSLDKYMPYFYDRLYTLIDYIDDDKFETYKIIEFDDNVLIQFVAKNICKS